MYVGNNPGHSVNGGQDNVLIPRFFIEPVPMPFRSAQEGRPIFEDQEFVEILIPGAKSSPVRPVSDEDRRTWPREYEAFKRSESQEGLSGTPLKEWPAMNRSMVKEFNGVNIYTVEQLVAMPDSLLQNAGLGAREWQAKAKVFLDQAAGGAAASALAAELEAMRADNEGLKAQVTELIKRLDEGASRKKREAA